jgi:precorrin-4/cobalt-precorrin-4 C11-methyltransferase
VHQVHFISAGPGDPELITIAGLSALRRCPAVLAPATFLNVFSSELAGKEVESPFQMDHATLISWVDARLSSHPVAFLVPGDFGLFCPFQSFVAHFGERAKVIPGVGAHAAAAALLRKTFDLPAVAHATVLTSPRAHAGEGRVRVRDYAQPGHTLILYMNDLPLSKLVEEMRWGFGRNTPVAILESIGCSEERVTRGTLDDICERVGDRDPFGLESQSPEPSLALVVAGDVLEADEDPSWWDRRYERIWKPRAVR